ncbi:MAG: hypothetical protein GVY25_02560 [Bacteroidetes bacterium]|jgi:hypothetical protein|nr:hypothetical protein [Bacteroidota bacterium]
MDRPDVLFSAPSAWLPRIVGGMALLAIMLSSAPADAQFRILDPGRFSIAAGATVHRLDDLSSAADMEAATGYHLGGFYDRSFNVGPAVLSVGSGVVFRRVGAYTFHGRVPSDPSARLLNGRSFTIYAFDVPLTLLYAYDAFQRVQPYAFAGPRVSILRGERDLDTILEDIVASAQVGIGVDVPVPGVSGLVVAPEMSYARDLSNVVKENASLRFARLTDDGFGGSSVALRLRIYLPF